MLELNSHIRILLPDGSCRYGYIQTIAKYGMEVVISFYEEGLSKITYEESVDEISGCPLIDWKTFLTSKEQEIVPLLAANLPICKIASTLFCTESTIRSQIRNLRIKLQLENKVQLVYYCQGLLKKLSGNANYQVLKKYETIKN